MSLCFQRIKEEKTKGEEAVDKLQKEIRDLKEGVENPAKDDSSEGGKFEGMLTYEECAEQCRAEKVMQDFKIEELELDLVKYTKDIKKLTTDNDDLKMENNNLAADAEEDMQRINELETENEKLSKAKEDLESENEKLRKENANLKHDLKQCHDSHDQIVTNTNIELHRMQKAKEAAEQGSATSDTIKDPVSTAEHQAQNDALLEAHRSEVKQYEDKLQAITQALANIQSISALHIARPAAGDLPSQLREIYTIVHGITTEMQGMIKHEECDAQLATQEQNHKNEVERLKSQLHDIQTAVDDVYRMEDFQKSGPGENQNLVEDINAIFSTIKEISATRRVLEVAALHEQSLRDDYFHELLVLVKKALGGSIDNESLEMKRESEQDQLAEALRLFVARIERGELVTKKECDERNLVFLKDTITDMIARGELVTSAACEERIRSSKEELATLKSLVEENMDVSKHAEGEMEDKQKADFFNKIMDLLKEMTHEPGWESDDIQKQGDAILSAIKYISTHTDDGNLMLTRAKHDELQRQLSIENTALKAQLTQAQSSISLPMAQPSVLLLPTSEVDEKASRDALDKCQQTNEEYKAQITSLLSTISDMEKKLKEAAVATTSDDERATSKEALDNCQKSNEEYRNEIKSLKHKIHDLEKTIKEVNTAKDDEVKSAQIAFSTCQKEIESYQDTINTLILTNTDLETQLSTLRDTTISPPASTNADSQEALNDAQQTIEEQKDLIMSLSDQVHNLHAKIKELENLHDAAGALSPKSEAALERCKRSNREFKTEINDLDAEVRDLKKKIVEAEAKNKTLETEKKELLAKVNELKSTIDGLEIENKKLEKNDLTRIVALAQRSSAAGNGPQTQVEETDNLKKKISELEATIRDLQQHDTRRILAMAAANTAASQVPNAGLSGGSRAHEQEITQLKKRVQDAQGKYHEERGFHQVLKNKHEALQKELRELKEGERKLLASLNHWKKFEERVIVSDGNWRVYHDRMERFKGATEAEKKTLLQELKKLWVEKVRTLKQEIGSVTGMSQTNLQMDSEGSVIDERQSTIADPDDVFAENAAPVDVVAIIVSLMADINSLKGQANMLQEELNTAKLKAATEAADASTGNQSPNIESNERLVADLRDQIRSLEETIHLIRKEPSKTATEGGNASTGSDYIDLASESDAKTIPESIAQIQTLENALKLAEEKHAEDLKRSLDAASLTCEQEKRNKDATIRHLRNELASFSGGGAGRKPSDGSDSSGGKSSLSNFTPKSMKIALTVNRIIDGDKPQTMETVILGSTRTDIEFCLYRAEEGLNAMAAERRSYNVTPDDTRVAQEASAMARRLSEKLHPSSPEKEMLFARSNFWAGITAYYAENPHGANELLAAARGVKDQSDSIEAQYYDAWVNGGTTNKCPTTKECFKGFRLGYGFTQALGSAFSSPKKEQKLFVRKDESDRVAKRKKSRKVQVQSSIQEEQLNLYDDSDNENGSRASRKSTAEGPLMKAHRESPSEGEPLETSSDILNSENTADFDSASEEQKLARADSQGEEDFVESLDPFPVGGKEDYLTDEETEITPAIQGSQPLPAGREDGEGDDDTESPDIADSAMSRVASVSRYFGSFFG